MERKGETEAICACGRSPSAEIRLAIHDPVILQFMYDMYDMYDVRDKTLQSLLLFGTAVLSNIIFDSGDILM